MNYKITDIEGIGTSYTKELEDAGIPDTETLLNKCGHQSGRKVVADVTGIDAKKLLEWVNMADLMRINGVGKQYAELLEDAGVDTVKELRNRNAENLQKALAEQNDKKKVSNTTPSLSHVQKWIEEAKTMEPKVSY